MSLLITEDCINCGGCLPECPNHAIYEPGVPWTIADGTNLTGPFFMKNGVTIDAEDDQPALSDEVYYVVPEKCTECEGFYEEPQCVSVCPVDCCLDDPSWRETTDELLSKKVALHGE